MNVSGAAGSAWTAPPASSGGSAKSAAAGNSPEQEFLDYMKLTPAQRFEEDWLRAHGMTRKDLDSMKPEERQKIAEERAEAQADIAADKAIIGMSRAALATVE